MEIKLPATSLVVLIGPSGSGKSTFAARHFGPHEVVSSDQCRAMISDDANDQSVTSDAFALAHTMLAMRLKHDKLAVLDATSVQRESRAPLLQLARAHDCMAVAIVLDMPEALCVERNSARLDRSFGAKVIQRQQRDLRRSLRALQREGFRRVFVLRDPEQVAQITITREPLWVDQRHERGPFDIIGDVHGCFDELRALLHKLDYTFTPTDDPAQPWQVTPPPGRRAIFLGDLVDRGPQTPEVLALVMRMVQDGAALCVAGNHDVKLARALQGKKVALRHGLAESMAQLEATSPEQRQQIMRFLDGLISHYMLDGGALCVAHAGLTQNYQGRASGRVRQFALYGDTDGEVDSFGLPVRHDWAASYRGQAMVVYGHTPTPEARWVNNTMCIDTGCVFGGKLTALRYPEREVVSVDAARVYAEPVRPLVLPEQLALHPQQASDTLLDLEDIQGKRLIETTLLGKIMIPPDQASAALEVMSRYAVDPRWLIYLPPTMSPCATSQREGLLEHPDEAFDSYAGWGVSHVICQQKHMGSRAILVVTRSPEVAITRFGLDTPGHGVIVTRTGRPFFSDDTTRDALLTVTRDAITRAGLWDSLNTDWVCLDAELMPWSAKAMSLLQHQYAATGAAARRARGPRPGRLRWRPRPQLVPQVPTASAWPGNPTTRRRARARRCPHPRLGSGPRRPGCEPPWTRGG